MDTIGLSNMICIPNLQKLIQKELQLLKNSMVELNKIILDSAVKNRINSYCLPPTDFMNGNKVN